jgi:hypothetical protein
MPGLLGSRLFDLIRSELGFDLGAGDGRPCCICWGCEGRLAGDSDGL